jgi:osomolarity two-component system phosphorelay intermediate protein YPD1
LLVLPHTNTTIPLDHKIHHLTKCHSEKKDLNELSQLGHFLKGSSATLGLIHVRDGCEKIQHFGNGLDENGSGKLSDEVALKNTEKTLKEVEVEYNKVEKFLRRFYGEEVKDEPEPKAEPESKEEKKPAASDSKEAKPTEKTDDTEEKPKTDASKK